MISTNPAPARAIRLDHNAPAAARPGLVTVGTFNVENWFEQGPNNDPELRPAKPEGDKVAVSRTIEKGHPDIEALQEVAGQDALDDLKGRVPEYPNAVYGDGNDKRGIEPAVISKFPVLKVVNHKDDRFPVQGESQPGKFSRTLLEVTVQLPNGKPLTIMSSHSKSHYPLLPPEYENAPKGTIPGPIFHAGKARADHQREAEAQRVHDIIEERLKQDPNAAIVACLDSNDKPEAPSIHNLLDGGPTHLVDPLIEAGIISHPPTHRLIDVMALSPAAARMFVPGSVRTVSVRGPQGEYGSDHVECELDLDPSKS